MLKKILYGLLLKSIPLSFAAALFFFAAYPVFADQELFDSGNTALLESFYPENVFFVSTDTVITAYDTAISGDNSDNWTVTNYGVISATGTHDTSGIYLDSSVQNESSVFNYGTIISSGEAASNSAGVYFNNGGQIANYEGASITGYDGVYSATGVLTAHNYGEIAALSANGIYGEGLDVYNYTSGRITGALYGIYSSGNSSGSKIVNEGYISGDEAAIYLANNPQEYFIQNKASGTITTSGSAAISFSGKNGVFLNDGYVENTSSAAGSAILKTNAKDDIIVNTGTMTATGAASGVIIEGNGTFFYNLGNLNAEGRDAVLVTGSSVTVVLGDYHIMKDSSSVYGPGSSIKGSLRNTGSGNSVILQDSGEEDDDFIDFQSIVMKGRNWTLSNSFNATGGKDNDLDIIAGALVINGTGSVSGGVTVRSGSALTIGDDSHSQAILTAGGKSIIEENAYFNGSGTFSGDITSSGTVYGNNFKIAGKFSNYGVLDLRTNNAEKNTFTVNSYSGDEDIVVINANLGGSKAASDKIIIDGGSFDGNTEVYVLNQGTSKGKTNPAGIIFAEFINGAVSSGVFTLANYVCSGAYEYGFSAAADNNWYLKPVSYRPETLSYLANIRSALNGFYHSYADRNDFDPEQRAAVWVRSVGGAGSQKAFGGAGKIESGNAVIHAGSRLFSFFPYGDGVLNLGIMAGYSSADNTAKIDNASRQSKGYVGNTAAGFYATWLSDPEDGLKFYADAWTQYGWQSNSIQIPGAGDLEYNSGVFLASVETGYSFDMLGEIGKLVLVPQAQALFTHYSADSAYDVVADSVIKNDTSAYFMPRLGVRVKSTFEIFSKTVDPFAEFNWYYDSALAKAYFDSDYVELEKAGNILGLKLGANAWITDNVFLSLNFQGQSGENEYVYLGGGLSLKYVW